MKYRYSFTGKSGFTEIVERRNAYFHRRHANIALGLLTLKISVDAESF
jgi:hypothetical protein